MAVEAPATFLFNPEQGLSFSINNKFYHVGKFQSVHVGNDSVRLNLGKIQIVVERAKEFLKSFLEEWEALEDPSITLTSDSFPSIITYTHADQKWRLNFSEQNQIFEEVLSEYINAPEEAWDGQLHRVVTLTQKILCLNSVWNSDLSHALELSEDLFDELRSTLRTRNHSLEFIDSDQPLPRRFSPSLSEVQYKIDDKGDCTREDYFCALANQLTRAPSSDRIGSIAGGLRELSIQLPLSPETIDSIKTLVQDATPEERRTLETHFNLALSGGQQLEDVLTDLLNKQRNYELQLLTGHEHP